jgi:DnaJ-like protein
MIKEAYPLTWPAGWKRATEIIRSKFGKKRAEGWGMNSLSIDQATRFTLDEIKRLVGHSLSEDTIISTNLKLRNDGLPYSGQRQPADQGVAIYFTMKLEGNQAKQMVIACDQYDRIQDNIYAVGKTIEAMRAIERYGASDLLQRAFTGFQALPAGPAQRNWWDILLCKEDSSIETIKANYKSLAKEFHPDNQVTGNTGKFQEIQFAYEQAIKERQ